MLVVVVNPIVFHCFNTYTKMKRLQLSVFNHRYTFQTVQHHWKLLCKTTPNSLFVPKKIHMQMLHKHLTTTTCRDHDTFNWLTPYVVKKWNNRYMFVPKHVYRWVIINVSTVLKRRGLNHKHAKITIKKKHVRIKKPYLVRPYRSVGRQFLMFSRRVRTVQCPKNPHRYTKNPKKVVGRDDGWD